LIDELVGAFVLEKEWERHSLKTEGSEVEEGRAMHDSKIYKRVVSSW